MLSINNLREYCRTCLVKLEKSTKNGALKQFAIKKFPDLQHIIQVCISKASVGGDSFCSYAPFLCMSCFDKWLDFSKLYQLAIKADDEIRKVLEKAVFKTEKLNKSKQFDNINEYFVNNENLVDINEIEKYEENSMLFANSDSNNPINIKNDYCSLDDLNQSNRHNEQTIINSSQLDEQDEYNNNSSCSENKDNDFTPRKKNKNTQRSKSSRKSFCELKKNYKTRSTLAITSENPLSRNETSERGALFSNEGTKKNRYQCQQCNKYFFKKNKFDGHMRQIHEGVRRPYNCQECDKSYNLYKTLLQHKREYHSEKPQEVFKCDICEKKFKTGVILKQHLSNKHSEQKDAMRSICDQCGFIAAHQYSLSRHIINKHTETEQIKCEQCPKVFKTQYSLKYHVIGNHNPSNIKPFRCPECQMGFSRKTLLNQHTRTHLNYNERIKCDFEGCEIRFVKHGDKTHHMRLVHLKVKQHICDFCGEAFGAMQTLRHHRFIHTGEKPYECSICGQRFRQRTAMKTHRKTHMAKHPEKQDVITNLPEINLNLVNNLIS